jgi:hypothetical protein
MIFKTYANRSEFLREVPCTLHIASLQTSQSRDQTPHANAAVVVGPILFHVEFSLLIISDPVQNSQSHWRVSL